MSSEKQGQTLSHQLPLWSTSWLPSNVLGPKTGSLASHARVSKAILKPHYILEVLQNFDNFIHELWDLVACWSLAFVSWSGLAGASAILRLYAILCGREVGKEGSLVHPCQDGLGWKHSHFELEVAGDPGSRARFRTERLSLQGWIEGAWTMDGDHDM